MKYSILCIFTHFGRTYTFRNVELLCSNETVLEFKYTAMSDDNTKIASFLKANFCGYSVTE